MALVGLVALIGAAYASMRKRADAEMCLANLRIIYLQVRSGEHPDSPKWEPMGSGRAFLANYPRWPTRTARPLDLWCPMKGPSLEIDYRGPAQTLPKMKPDEAILSDRPGNHGPGRGGNVVLKTGQMIQCDEQAPAWAAAARSTSD